MESDVVERKASNEIAESQSLVTSTLELKPKQEEALRIMFSRDYNKTFFLDTAYIRMIDSKRTLILVVEQDISSAYVQAHFVLGSTSPEEDKIWWATFYSLVFYTNFMAQVPSLEEIELFRVIPYSWEENRDRFGNVSGKWKMAHLDFMMDREMSLNINIDYVLDIYRKRGQHGIANFWTAGPITRGEEVR